MYWIIFIFTQQSTYDPYIEEEGDGPKLVAVTRLLNGSSPISITKFHYRLRIVGPIHRHKATQDPVTRPNSTSLVLRLNCTT